MFTNILPLQYFATYISSASRIMTVPYYRLRQALTQIACNDVYFLLITFTYYTIIEQSTLFYIYKCYKAGAYK